LSWIDDVEARSAGQALVGSLSATEDLDPAADGVLGAWTAYLDEKLAAPEIVRVSHAKATGSLTLEQFLVFRTTESTARDWVLVELAPGRGMPPQRKIDSGPPSSPEGDRFCGTVEGECPPR
jgi:hypothetical protein